MLRLDSLRQSARKLALSVLAGACIGGYFLLFAGPGLRADFTRDDLANMYYGWRAPASEQMRDIALFFKSARSYRPVGMLFYHLLFDHYGFRTLPFRLWCYLLLLVNLWMAYGLVRRLTNSREIAALTVLLHAYHGRFWPLYVNTGTCFDLLCFFFYTASFLYYLRAREREFPVGWLRVGIWSGLYVLCMNSKEMAVSLPVVIAVYELLASPPRAWRRADLISWAVREGRVPLVGGALTALFILGRIAGREGLASVGGYRPVMGFSEYLVGARHFLGQALYEPEWLTPAAAGVIGLVLLAVAVRWRSLPVRLSLVWMLVGILPVAFISQRELHAAYIPSLALALWLAMVITRAAEGFSRLVSGKRLDAKVVFAGSLLALISVHGRYGRVDWDPLLAEGRQIRSGYEQLHGREQCRFPKASRILFLRDSLPGAEWGSVYLVYLCSRDPSLGVFQMDQLVKEVDGRAVVGFDMVFSYEQDRLVACDAGPFQRVTVRELPDRARRADCR